jgi:hypothetical protein
MPSTPEVPKVDVEHWAGVPFTDLDVRHWLVADAPEPVEVST